MSDHGHGTSMSMSGSGLSSSVSNSNFDPLDSASEWSDTSSLDGSMSGATTPILHRNFPPPGMSDVGAGGGGLMVSLTPGSASAVSSREQMQRLVDRLQQENRVLRMELDTQKLRTKALQEENKSLRQQSVMIVSAGGSVNLFRGDRHCNCGCL